MQKYVWNTLVSLKRLALMESDFAFLVLNQPILCDSKLIKSLWNLASIRALADGGSNRWLDFIEKESGDDLLLPDFISGDFDSILPKSKFYFESRQVNFIPTPDQDETDFTKALTIIGRRSSESRELQVNRVFALCENMGRFDHIMGNINTLHRSHYSLPKAPVIILSSQSITWVLPPGEHIIHVTEEYVKEEYCCGLVPVCGPTLINTTGLKWNMDGEVSEFGKLVSTSNTFAATEISINCNQSLVWISSYC